jgi:outer membrane protein OmpA-like peptidoglycan-associated protein
MHVTLRFVTVAAVVTALSGEPAHAQRPGTFEWGVFARRTAFDGSFNAGNAAGVGGWAGLFLLRNVAVDMDLSYTSTDIGPTGRLSHVPLHARVVYNAPLGEHFAFLWGAGYVHNEYGQDLGGSDDGVTGLFGFRVRLSRVVSIRAEGFADQIFSPVNKGASPRENFNWGSELGFSLQFGPGPRDGDRDGIPDRDDRCPGTQEGIAVSVAGCPLDDDRDGVWNTVDRCRGTARGELVDSRGCPRDTDQDGVFDSTDRCPNTARGEAVGASGCPLDTDGDGVSDARDQCADTPAGVIVDDTGCPVDADADGVPDGIDRCPNTAVGTEVEEFGCPALFREGARAVVAQGVIFEAASAQLTAGALVALDRVAESLRANREVRIEIAGHTDATGSLSTNMRLSQQRADAVRDYLVLRGIGADRLVARGLGPTSPIASNATPRGRALNRRVEFRIIP